MRSVELEVARNPDRQRAAVEADVKARYASVILISVNRLPLCQLLPAAVLLVCLWLAVRSSSTMY